VNKARFSIIGTMVAMLSIFAGVYTSQLAHASSINSIPLWKQTWINKHNDKINRENHLTVTNSSLTSHPYTAPTVNAEVLPASQAQNPWDKSDSFTTVYNSDSLQVWAGNVFGSSEGL